VRFLDVGEIPFELALRCLSLPPRLAQALLRRAQPCLGLAAAPRLQIVPRLRCRLLPRGPLRGNEPGIEAEAGRLQLLVQEPALEQRL
jgi:hypothetical protein